MRYKDLIELTINNDNIDTFDKVEALSIYLNLDDRAKVENMCYFADYRLDDTTLAQELALEYVYNGYIESTNFSNGMKVSSNDDYLNYLIDTYLS